MRHPPSVRSIVVASISAWLSLATGIAHANRAGTVEFAIGNVVAIDAAGATRNLLKHGEVNAGDRVHTNQGRAQIRFTDGAYVSLVPETEFQVRAYAYQGRRDASESSVLALLKGTIRAVSGAIARSGPDRFQINTPTATLGVRGTGGIVSVLADGSTRLTATSGIWIMTNPAGTIDVPAGGSALVTPIATEPPRRSAAQTHAAPHARPQASARQTGGQANQHGEERRDAGRGQASGTSQASGDATRSEAHAATEPHTGAAPGQVRGADDADARQHAAGAHAVHGPHGHMIAAVTGTGSGSATAPAPVPVAPLATSNDPLLAPAPTAPVTPPPAQDALPPAPAPLPPTPFDAITLIRSSTEDQQAHLNNTALTIGVNNDVQNIQLPGANATALLMHATTMPGTVVMETGNHLQDVYWGRWTGTITALAGGTLRNMQIAPGEGYHYIAGLPTAPNTMPTGGIINYTLAGATSPTVFVGTGGSAIPPGLVDPASTLRIDFATGKVGIDLKMNWSAAQMGGTAMQIQITTNPSNLQASPISLINAVSGSGFQPRFVGDLTQANNTGGVLAAFGAPATSGLNCSADCTAGVRGFVAGPAATSAGVAFRFGNNSNSSAVTGVAGFKQ